MTGETVVFTFLSIVIACVVVYAFWPLIEESRIAYRVWAWVRKRRG